MWSKLGAAMAASAILLLPTGPGQAQDFPSKAIRIIVPYPAGGTVDVAARRIAQKITEDGGPHVIIDNRPGNAGTVAVVTLKQAPADGYTIMLGDSSSLAASVSLVRDLPFDPVRDFAPVTRLWSFPSLLIVPSSLGVRTVTELAGIAKGKAGGLTYGSQGIGSGGHLLGSLLATAFGTAMTHVPYRGGQAAITDLTQGRIDVLFSSYASVAPFLQSGELRALALPSEERLAAAPSVPTMAEAGYPQVMLDTWFGIVVLADTNPDIVRKLHEILVKAARSPDLVAAFASVGTPIETSTPEAFGDLIKTDIVRLREVTKQAGIQPN